MSNIFKKIIPQRLECVRKGVHTPLESDLKNFLLNSKITFSSCDVCGAPLLIIEDEENQNYYHINESQ